MIHMFVFNGIVQLSCSMETPNVSAKVAELMWNLCTCANTIEPLLQVTLKHDQKMRSDG